LGKKEKREVIHALLLFIDRNATVERMERHVRQTQRTTAHPSKREHLLIPQSMSTSINLCSTVRIMVFCFSVCVCTEYLARI